MCQGVAATREESLETAYLLKDFSFPSLEISESKTYAAAGSRNAFPPEKWEKYIKYYNQRAAKAVRTRGAKTSRVRNHEAELTSCSCLSLCSSLVNPGNQKGAEKSRSTSTKNCCHRTEKQERFWQMQCIQAALDSAVRGGRRRAQRRCKQRSPTQRTTCRRAPTWAGPGGLRQETGGRVVAGPGSGECRMMPTGTRWGVVVIFNFL